MRIATPSSRAATFLTRHPFLAVPALFYGWHLSPSMGLGDASLFLGDMQVPVVSAFANAHNIAVLTGWAFSHLPWGTMELRGNLVSWLYGSLTVAAFYLLLSSVFASRLTASFCAAVLMVSHSMFWHSTLVESYATNTLLIVLAFWLIWRWSGTRDDRDLAWLVFLSGLSLFQHAQLAVIGIAAMVLAGSRAWEIVRTLPRGEKASALLRLAGRLARSSVLGLVPYALALLLDALRLQSFSAAWFRASGGSFRSLMLGESPLDGLREVSLLLFQQYPSPYLLAVPVGLVLWIRRSGAASGWAAILAFLAIPAVTAWFFAGFGTWDRFAFLLPLFLACAFWGAYWVDAIRLRTLRAGPAVRGIAVLVALACVLYPPYLYARIPSYAAEGSGFWAGRYSNAYTANTHDLTRILANPSKRRFRDVEEYVRDLLAALPEGATYVDDDSRLFYSVDYVRRQYGRRPDVRTFVINTWGIAGWGLDEQGLGLLLGESYRGNRPLFLVSVDDPFREWLSRTPRRFRFALFPIGDGRRWIYRLRTESETDQP